MDNTPQSSHYFYNRNLRPLARTMRKNMTKAEACLWKYALRGGMMKGYSFNRQRPVMNYIADFFCRKLRLVVEVDGITHYQEQTRLKDTKKQQDLQSEGFKVLRFTDDDVLNDIEAVRAALILCIDEREKALGLLSSPVPPLYRPAHG